MMRSRRPYGSSRHGVYERGATAVEFALIVPVFLALVFGTLELALTFQHQSVLNAAANTAARAASLGTPSSIVQNAQSAILRNSGALSTGDYMYVYNPDTTGDPVGASDSDPCPRESCDEYAFNGTSFVGLTYTYTTSAPTITNNYGTFYPWSSCNSSANYCTYSRQNYNGGYYTSSSCLTVGNASTPCYTAISTNALQSTTYTVAQTQGGSTVGTPVTTTVTQQCTAYRAGANTSSNPYVYYLDSSSCANVSGSATPPTSSSEFDPSQLSASNGCAVGIYLSAHQNWVTGGANLAGLGPELDLQAQKVASLTSTSTTSYWGATSSTCGQSIATKRLYNHHHRWNR
ncbi:MAG TPA: hypothetical protein DHW34_03710 [Actinobacteria bacterium]|mgnify:CR=1 FL=1|nr:hypothetical protein [Actinomycetota bacterium]